MTYSALVQFDSGGYDDLYAASRPQFLWDSNPGRLVLRIAEWLEEGSSVFDVGCGDGKNALYLEERSFSVLGIDPSSNAIDLLRARFSAAGRRPSGQYIEARIQDFSTDVSFDCLLSYGLFHCLAPTERYAIHTGLQSTVRVGGLMIFTTLLDTTSLPSDHGTPTITLTNSSEIVELLGRDWQVIEYSEGSISESHPPIAGWHTHDAAWLVARRIR
jgi:2-polyprenyl-3-methyl-5-hydroxy-6-metoxy-1,4-benzoquinol methylase